VKVSEDEKVSVLNLSYAIDTGNILAEVL